MNVSGYRPATACAAMGYGAISTREDGCQCGAQIARRTPGHSICSKSMRRTSAGGITRLHLGHTASSDARTFSRLIFRELGMD